MNCIIIGNGKMAIDCYKILLSEGWNILKIVSSPLEDSKGSSFQKYLGSIDVDYISTEALNKGFDFSQFDDLEVDIVFTINSYKILKSNWFSIPKIGIVNFHNSLLPDYKGVNIPFWVIYNGETTHGITWHFIDEKIDEGHLLVQKKIEVKERETSASLTAKCIKTGIEAFPEVLSKINTDQEQLKSIGSGSYYSKKDFPDGDGLINFSNPFKKIDALVRGLNYLPFGNDFCYAHIESNDTIAVINRVSSMEKKSNVTAGTYLGVNEKGKPVVACQDKLIILEECMSKNVQLLNAEDIFEHTKLFENE